MAFEFSYFHIFTLIMLDKNQIAQRIAKELRDGYYVNLGIGIPTLVANYIPEDINVTLQSENGLLGMGPFPIEGKEDADLINAGKQTITTLPGSSFFDSAMSFGMITGRKGGSYCIGCNGSKRKRRYCQLENPRQISKRNGWRYGSCGQCQKYYCGNDAYQFKRRI